MLTSSPIPKQTVGRTFLISIVVLGVVALAQLGMVCWAFIAGIHSTPAHRDTRREVASTPVQAPGKANFNEDPLPAETTPSSTQVASVPGPTPVIRANPAKPVSQKQDLQNELAEQAKALRERGDMSTALTKLREAQAISADNPYILSEMALTYEKMDLQEKSMELWRRIYDMGEQQAGIYYPLADAKLKVTDTPSSPETASKKDTDGFQPGSVMALLDVTKGESDASGKNFTLKVPLKARPTSKIDVHDVSVVVLFYEQLEDQSVVSTNADVTPKWSTLPVDWNNGDIEILEVNYAAAGIKSKAKNPDTRRYFGYIVRVYYKNVLQDVRAEPISLLKQFPPPLTFSSEDMR